MNVSVRKISKQGLDKLIVREGKRNKAYLDTKGIPTIGVGHTGPEVKLGLVWTDEQVQYALLKDCLWAEEAVNEVNALLTQNQFDALVSFVFNIGANAFAKSTMKKLLDKGMFAEAAEQFNRWVIPKEITGRRMSEKAQFLS
jgi:lysozyme